MKIKRVNTGPDVDVTFDRMVEIVKLIKPTQHARSEVEYSALLGVATSIIAIEMGHQPTAANCSVILGIIMGKLVPELEAELKKP